MPTEEKILDITELPKKYNHKQAEANWQDSWFNSDLYKWDETLKRPENYVIDTPPPTVSGMLHMGHVFSYTQADFIARYQRMKGMNVFYPIGFDDNGLPTERLVEKVKKVRANQMSREDFIKLCQEVVVEAEEEFRALFKSIGLSFDWSQEYQTISEQSRKISQLSFLDLYKKNKIFRKPQPSLWDVADQTALSQAEIEDKEQSGVMYDIKFTLENDDTELIIATTRPELIAANVAIFYNPEDDRYKNLDGKFALSPLFKVRLPIIADCKVDIEKGSGLVMCSTFGDITDMEWWRQYNLPTRIIVSKYGKIENLTNINQEDWQSFQEQEKLDYYISQIAGLKLKAAKEKMVELLEQENLLIAKKDVQQNVKCAERSGAPLEILVSSQWFIKVLDIKDQLLEQAKKINWFPNHMKIRLDQWIEGLQWDWCISRQRYFGVPFPVWYSKRAGEEGKIIIANEDQLPVNPLVDLPKGYSREEVEPELDIMDTWATSSVSPQLSSLAISEDYNIDYDKHKKLYPFDLRPQAHEIIRTWAFGTITKAFLHTQEIPWKNIMISGWCLAEDKTKMSKSKGNVVTPVDLIREKSADAVRFWASNSSLGSDIAYSEDVFKIGQKLINKLWNASKFVAIHLDKIDELQPLQKDNDKIIVETDKWIISRLQQVIKSSTQYFEKYEYWRARNVVEDFFWNDFCDNYLEIVKVRVYGEDNSVTVEESQSAAIAIYYVLHNILHLFAPFIPFICEEIYSVIFKACYQRDGSIHRKGSWPDHNNFIFKENSLISGEILLKVVEMIRKAKTENNVSLKHPIEKLEISVVKADIENLEENLQKIKSDLKHVVQAKSIEIIDDIAGGKELVIENIGNFAINYVLNIVK